MLILSTETDKIQVCLNAAHTSAPMQLFATWRDVTTLAFTPGRSFTVTNGASDVDLVPSPLASTQRVIDYINVYNSDTGAKIVTVKFETGGSTEVILIRALLGIGEALSYQEGRGWQVMASDGSVKTAQYLNASPLAAAGWNMTVLSGDVINNNAVLNTLQDVTGLVFAVEAGSKYYFEVMIPYTAAVATTGSRWTINGPAFTLLSYTSEYTLTATSKTVNCAAAYQIPAASSATSLTIGNVVTLWGFVIPSANGNIQVQFASEIANSAITAKAGGFVRWIQVA